MNTLVQLLVFPSSALLALTFLLATIALFRYAGNNRVVKLLGTTRTARILLAVGAVMLAVEGTWSVPLHRTLVFTVYVLVLLLSLAFTLLNASRRNRYSAPHINCGFLLNHLGIFLIIWGALFGAPDVSRSKMIVAKGYARSYSYTYDGQVVPLPFSVALEDFVIDYYSDGTSPCQFTSHLIVGDRRVSVAVNAPVSVDGYTLYQDSYDRQGGRYTVLQVVRDPWLPVIYLGMLLLAVGAVMMLLGRWKVRFVLPVTLLITALFTALTIAKINFGTLMPALRSWWFVPHLFIYMVAYSLMALSLIAYIWSAVPIKKKAGMMPLNTATSQKAQHWQTLSDNLMRSSTALLIIGMLTGSVWARQAWGDYWAWDPKENWAAVTWLVALMHLHLQGKRNWRHFAILVLAFLALQITWYGVNYLPSAMDSLHTYTRS